MKTRLFRLLAWLAALYAAVLCVLYFQQENLLFHPAKLTARYAYTFRLPHEEIALPVNGAVLNGLHFRPPHAHSKGAILFFHGNAGALDSWGEVAQRFAELGYDSYVFDYRGYGKSSGQIRSQADLLADAERMAQYVQQRFPAGPIMVVGNSIGNGMAAHVAAQLQSPKLVLISPYFRLRDLIREKMPFVPPFLIKYPLPTADYLAAAPNTQVLIFHGTLDTLIPAVHGQRLAQALGERAQYQALSAGHNDMFNQAVLWQTLEQALP